MSACRTKYTLQYVLFQFLFCLSIRRQVFFFVFFSFSFDQPTFFVREKIFFNLNCVKDTFFLSFCKVTFIFERFSSLLSNKEFLSLYSVRAKNTENFRPTYYFLIRAKYLPIDGLA